MHDVLKELIEHLGGLTTEGGSERLRWTLSKVSEAHETQGAGDK